ncbi:alpha/beta hydrolase [Oxynema sp. CENA135]|uniref:alpha/beta hydrolase n=1 Tax=Oxynema sp. CENA135 TaxID=984206 RepID=UPI001909DB19|nr:alpha/beta hydrolase-fold protein [Oxynema sp. CENA135]MBK4731266.1 alpha/beta hydrolase [Oxynema sp. CENA135]
MSEFTKGGQVAWFHDEGHPAGIFHTYDQFSGIDGSDRPRKIHIFLPRNYETSEDRYPVVYMNDGHTAFFRAGLARQSWQVAERLGELYDRGAIPKLLVVAVHPLDRDREYTPDLTPSLEPSGLETYAPYLVNSVKGFVDRHYRTRPENSQTTVVGAGRAGLAAFYIACRYGDRFGNGAAMSPSFFVGLERDEDLFTSLSRSPLLKLTGSALDDRARRPRLWLDWGLVRDGTDHNSAIERQTTKRGREMAELLQYKYGYRRDRDLFVREDPEGEHCEASWSRRFPEMLKAFYEKSH